MPKFRFNIYYQQGQEVVAEADTVDAARELVMDGQFLTVGDTWDSSAGYEVELAPNQPECESCGPTASPDCMVECVCQCHDEKG